jgi:hypothetical protein
MRKIKIKAITSKGAKIQKTVPFQSAYLKSLLPLVTTFGNLLILYKFNNSIENITENFQHYNNRLIELTAKASESSLSLPQTIIEEPSSHKIDYWQMTPELFYFLSAVGIILFIFYFTNNNSSNDSNQLIGSDRANDSLSFVSTDLSNKTVVSNSFSIPASNQIMTNSNASNNSFFDIFNKFSFGGTQISFDDFGITIRSVIEAEVGIIVDLGGSIVNTQLENEVCSEEAIEAAKNVIREAYANYYATHPRVQNVSDNS